MHLVELFGNFCSQINRVRFCSKTYRYVIHIFDKLSFDLPEDKINEFINAVKAKIKLDNSEILEKLNNSDALDKLKGFLN